MQRFAEYYQAVMGPDRDTSFFLRMVAWLVIVAVYILLIPSCTTVYSVEEPRACNAPYVVVLETSDSYGAGVAISDTLIVTAHHVIDEVESDDLVIVYETECNANGRLEYGRTMHATIERTLPDRDLAWLRLRDGRMRVSAELRQSPVMPGDMVWLHSLRAHGSSVIVRTPTMGTTEYAGGVNRGDSGGAVVDDRGRLVGIIQQAGCPKNRPCEEMIIGDGADPNDWTVTYRTTFSMVIWGRLP